MSYKRVSWTVPLVHFEAFNGGMAVRAIVPACWGLQAGDHLGYECGQSIGGIAEVVQVVPGEPRPESEEMECELVKLN